MNPPPDATMLTRQTPTFDVFCEASRDCFLQFLVGLFHMDPAERWTAHQALLHAFVNDQVGGELWLTGEGLKEPARPQKSLKDPAAGIRNFG